MDLKKIAKWVVAGAGIHLGLLVFNINVVGMLAGITAPAVTSIIYLAAGVAGVFVGMDLLKK